MDSWYRHGLIVKKWTHGIDIDPWYLQGLMVWTYGIDNTHGIDLNSWYSIGTHVQEGRVLHIGRIFLYIISYLIYLWRGRERLEISFFLVHNLHFNFHFLKGLERQ